MRQKPPLLGVLGFVAAVATAWMSSAQGAEPPVETFFQRAAHGAVKISPDGTHLATLMRLNGRNNLEIIDLERREARAITNLSQVDVIRFHWLGNRRLLFAAGDAEEATGYAFFAGWYAVDHDGGRMERVRGFRSVLEHGTDDGEHIVVTRGGPSLEVYSLDTYTGRAKPLGSNNPGEVIGWVVDRSNVPRVAHSFLKGVHTLWYRDGDAAPWTKIDEGTRFRLHFTPLAFDYDDKTLYVSSREGDHTAIRVYDLAAKKLGEVVAASPRADVDKPVFSRAKRALIGVRYEGDMPGVTWFDADTARLQRVVDQALPNIFNVLDVADANRRRAVVFAYSDVDPGTIYLLDTDKLTLEEIAKTRPWIDPKQMAERKPIRYSARDGLQIPAYLTLPKAPREGKPPLVVRIHGGPWVRDHWGFNPETQFFASRGYAVLEPQYRGSLGYGWKLYTSGFRQWGLAMQDDVDDGVRYLVEQGLVDPQRVCLFGGSYGGYAVLWGLIKTPELYKCGVAFVAVTDISLLLDVSWYDRQHAFNRWYDFDAKELIGDFEKEAEKLNAVSPLVHADKLKAPVLLAYGEKDERVPLKHGKQFRAALDKGGKTYEWIVYPGEGHGFNKDENPLDFWRRVDAFLKKHLQ